MTGPDAKYEAVCCPVLARLPAVSATLRGLPCSRTAVAVAARRHAAVAGAVSLVPGACLSAAGAWIVARRKSRR